MTGTRKRFYAVARGREPGIYRTWDGPLGAQAQVKGFAGAVFKGFATLEEAQRFIDTATVQERRPSPRQGEPSHPHESPHNVDAFVYTDGGCIDNPGPGGWAAVILKGDTRTEICGGYRFTTNNRMELQACIQALRLLERGSRAAVYTDSQYVANGVEKGWARRWRSQNWMRDKVHRAENADLWAELLSLLDDRLISFHWVRGHAGNPENERCDELAKRAAMGVDLIVDEVYEKQRKVPV